jgi:hypothetical protein
LNAIEKKYKDVYKFGIPMSLLDYDATGAADSWASMVANITYSYTIEIGPTDEQTAQSRHYSQGFHVSRSKIDYISNVIYTGIYEYLKSFLRTETDSAINEKCSKDYDNLMATFNGYWANNTNNYE